MFAERVGSSIMWWEVSFGTKNHRFGVKIVTNPARCIWSGNSRSRFIAVEIVTIFTPKQWFWMKKGQFELYIAVSMMLRNVTI